MSVSEGSKPTPAEEIAAAAAQVRGWRSKTFIGGVQVDGEYLAAWLDQTAKMAFLWAGTSGKPSSISSEGEKGLTFVRVLLAIVDEAEVGVGGSDD